MTASKKEVELWRLGQFKTLVPGFPAGEVESTEEPDFLVRGRDCVIGIELTDLYSESRAGQVPEQATEAMRRRVIARAQEIYITRHLPPVIASFFLDDRMHVKKSEIEVLAAELVNLVAHNLPTSNSTTKVPKDWENTQALPSILRSLSIHRLNAITKTFFSAPGTIWIAPLTRMDVERVLSSKELKYFAYRAKCEEAWLIINADIESMATWFEFDVEVLKETFTTRFDRVFLVEPFSGKVHELSLRAGDA